MFRRLRSVSRANRHTLREINDADARFECAGSGNRAGNSAGDGVSGCYHHEGSGSRHCRQAPDLTCNRNQRKGGLPPRMQSITVWPLY